MKWTVAIALSLIIPTNGRAAAGRPANDRAAIGALLDAYRTAVSRKDQASFETLLLGRDIPFAYVPEAPTSADPTSWRDYDGFRRAVFDGPAFTQSFRDVRVELHGALAHVELVYSNRDRQGVHSGWKTMQLVRVDGRWKIASEFFTGLP